MTLILIKLAPKSKLGILTYGDDDSDSKMVDDTDSRSNNNSDYTNNDNVER